MSKNEELQIKNKKQLKIKEYSDQLGGVKSKYLTLENQLNKNFGGLELPKIFEMKKDLKKLASEMKKLVSNLKKLGVVIDLEQR